MEAQNYSGDKKKIFYSVCPAFRSTNINKHAPGSRSPELGADSILYLVNTPNEELENGSFYSDDKVEPEICVDKRKLEGMIQSNKLFIRFRVNGLLYLFFVIS